MDNLHKHADLLEELRIILGMINETQAKGRLLMNRSDEGYELKEEEVRQLEHDAITALARFAEWQLKARKIEESI